MQKKTAVPAPERGEVAPKEVAPKELIPETTLSIQTKEEKPRSKKVYKPRTKLTFKQEQFCQRYIKNKGNGTKTALEVYNSTRPEIAKVTASQTLTLPNVVNRLDQLLRENDLSLPVCVHRLSKQTTARKKVVLGSKIEEVPDNPTINDALKTAFKLHGVLSDSNIAIDNRSLNLGLSERDSEALQNISAVLKDMNSKLSLGQSGEVIDIT